MGTKPEDWAWAKLGIAQTSDKDAIHAAYKAKRAQLDAEAVRISAFAELTEAREKALFLASEMLREEERGDETSASFEVESIEHPGTEDVPTIDQPELESEFDGPWEKTSQHQSNDGEWEPGGRFESAGDRLQEIFEEPEDLVPTSVDRGSEGWTSSDGYSANLDQSLAVIVGIEQPSYDKSGSWTSGAPTPFLERYRIRQYGFVWVIGIFFLISMCGTLVQEDEQSPPDAQVQYSPPAVRVDDQVAYSDQLEEMVKVFFGQTWDYSQVVDADGEFASNLSRRVNSQDLVYEEARAFLRVQILRATARAPKDQALTIAQMHLAWLSTAKEQGGGACREVTSDLFMDGIPQMEGDWVAFERELASTLLQSGKLSSSRRQPSVPPLPDWVLADASAILAMDPLTIRNALEDYASSNRCAVEIGLLQAMLAKPDDVTPEMLAAI